MCIWLHARKLGSPTEMTSQVHRREKSIPALAHEVTCIHAKGKVINDMEGPEEIEKNNLRKRLLGQSPETALTCSIQ